MNSVKKIIGIIVFTAIIVLAMTNCVLPEEECSICGGSVTFTMMNGEAPNKVIIAMSSGEWVELTSNGYYINGIKDELTLNKTSTIPGSNSSWLTSTP